MDCFSHTLSTFQFVLDHRVSSTHTSDLLGIISIAVRACVCEKGFEVVCVRLLNQYLLHPFQLWDLASSVYLSPSPQPSQNAYIDTPSLAAFPREKGVPAATPTGMTEHPGPCQPMLAAESTAHADRRLQERPGIFYFISGDGEHHVTHTQYHSVYIFVFLIILFMTLLVSCVPQWMCMCVWMVTLDSTLTSGVSLTSHHTNRPIRQDRRHHSNR